MPRIYIKDYDTYANFPDDTPQEVMQTALRKQFPIIGKQPDTGISPPPSESTLTPFEERLGVASPTALGVYGAGKEVGKALISPLQRAGETIGKAAAYPFASREALAYDSALTPTMGELVGAPLQIASVALPYGRIAKGAGALVGKVLPSALTEVAGQATAGAIGGYTYEAGEKLQKGEAPIPGLMTSVGAVAPYGLSKAAQVDVLTPFKRATIDKIDKAITREIEKGIFKGIQPLTSEIGKTAAQTQAFRGKGVRSVKTIMENKPNLEFVRGGEMVSGVRPDTVREYSEAIDQTLKPLFAKTEEAVIKAGKENIRVNLIPLAEELTNLAKNKTLVDTAYKNPGLIPTIEQAATNFETRGFYTPSEAQNMLTELNKSLGMFKSNPSFEAAGKVQIDNLVAKYLRDNLDDAVTKATGAEWQAFRNDYGALKALRTSVTKQAQKVEKKVKGAPDLTDTVTSGTAVYALANLNPKILAATIATKGLRYYAALKRDPDKIVSKMFRNVERLMEKSKRIPTIREGKKKVLEPSSTAYKIGGTAYPLSPGKIQKALPPGRPEPYITGEGFAMRSGSTTPVTQAEYLPYQAIPVEAKTSLRNAIRKGWTAVKGEKTPLLVIDRQGRQVAWDDIEKRFLPVERPYSAYQLGKMENVTSGLYGIGGVEGEALSAGKTTTRGLYSK